MIEAGADKFAGQIPTIPKVNSSNSLARGGDAPSQAITGSVAEARGSDAAPSVSPSIPDPMPPST